MTEKETSGSLEGLEIGALDASEVGEAVVDHVGAARARMEAAGVEFIGPVQRSGSAAWSHFRGPDGNVYEIIEKA